MSVVESHSTESLTEAAVVVGSVAHKKKTLFMDSGQRVAGNVAL
jgi:hypothetical protein